jgi:L-arabinose transport system permease protein
MNLRALADRGGMIVVAAACFVVCCIAVPGFRSPSNLVDILVAVSTIGLVACTMLFCLAGGDFDLSVGSTVALSGVVAALLLQKTGSIALALIVPIAVGAVVGFANGVVIARLGVNALIATLATMQIVRGAARIVTEGSSIGIADAGFAQLGKFTVAGIQAPVLYLAVAIAIFGVLLNRTVFGRNVLAIGGNAQAARLSGIPVIRTKILVFTLQGIVAAFAGIVLAARVSSAQPNSGEGLELQVISGCVLGGVSLTGGVGTLSGTIAGVCLMGMLRNAMDLTMVPTFWQLVASGTILLIAVLLDRAKHRNSERH